MRPEVIDLLDRNAAHAREVGSRFDDVQTGQRPTAVTVCCSDSRVLQDHMWGNAEPGQLFTCSNIGNRVVQQTGDGPVIAGDVLYPLVHTGTEIVIVVGHTGCGAITAAYEDLTDGVAGPPGIAHCLNLLKPHLERGVERLPVDVPRAEAVNRLVEFNVDRQIDRLRASDAVPEAVTAVGVVYDFQDVYGGRRGEAHVVNVEGETGVDALRTQHPEIDARIDRHWTY